MLARRLLFTPCTTLFLTTGRPVRLDRLAAPVLVPTSRSITTTPTSCASPPPPSSSFSNKPPFPRRRQPAVLLSAFVAALAVAVGLLALRPPRRLEAEHASSSSSSNSHFNPSELPPRLISAKELLQRKGQSLWVVLDGVVWDVTAFADNHPGGADVLVQNAGKDISALFRSVHSSALLLDLHRHGVRPVGTLDPATAFEVEHAEQEQLGFDFGAVERARGSILPPLDHVFDLAHFESLAHDVLTSPQAGPTGAKLWGYFASHSDHGVSFRSNRSAWSHLRLLPRVLVPVANVDHTTTMAGHASSAPFFIAPVGQYRLAHPDGEVAVLRAACQTGIPFCVSSASSTPIEDVLLERDRIVRDSAATDDEEGYMRAPVWWQIYMRIDRKDMADRIRRAVELGVDALVFTVDAPVIAHRKLDTAVHKSGSARKDVAGSNPTTALFDANLDWSDVAWIREQADRAIEARHHAVKEGGPSRDRVPLLIKGITDPRDAKLAFEAGADGIILSNHGGRQLDHAPAPISSLVRLRAEHPELFDDPRFEVYVDGGISTGTDVLKALCLGARGVGLGRAFVFATLCYGQVGTTAAINILQRELTTGQKLMGAKTLNHLSPDMVEVLSPLFIGKRASEI